MILAPIAQLASASCDPAFQAALRFLISAPADLPDGEHPIDGRKAFVRVMTYVTRDRSAGKLETHRDYVDIQVMLAGDEAVEWYDAAGLQVQVADPAKDVVFYQIPAVTTARFVLRPGLAALFLPADGHMPSLSAGKTGVTVRKAVAKVHVGAFA